MTDKRNRCPNCNQPVPPDQAKVEIGTDGLIVAASIVKGLGPPLISPKSCNDYSFYLDGKAIAEVVAFDQKKGLVWCYQKDEAGNLIIKGNGLLQIEKLEGKLTVKLRNSE